MGSIHCCLMKVSTLFLLTDNMNRFFSRVTFSKMKSQMTRTLTGSRGSFNKNDPPKVIFPLKKQEPKARLSPMQYHVSQEKGTERPYTGKYYQNKKAGLYLCVACHSTLFSSAHKYESGSGWPSFYDVPDKDAVAEITDTSLGMSRTEVVCSKVWFAEIFIFKLKRNVLND